MKEKLNFWFLNMHTSIPKKQTSHSRVMVLHITSWYCGVCLKMEPGKEQICVNIFKMFKLWEILSKLMCIWKVFTESLMFLVAQSEDATTTLEMEQLTQKSA